LLRQFEEMKKMLKKVNTPQGRKHIERMMGGNRPEI